MIEPVVQDLLYVVNSVLGAPNTPGFRPWQVTRQGGARPRVLARGSAIEYGRIGYPLPGRSVLPRGLNLIRQKLMPRLPARRIEQGLFDTACLVASRRIADPVSIVHFWDYLPKTTAYWKTRGATAIVDMQMTHHRSLDDLVARGAVPAGKGLNGEERFVEPALDAADVIICPSEYTRASLLPHQQSRSVVIPFGTDLPAPGGKPVAPRSGEPLCVLFAGNVNWRKGVDHLLEAWRSIDTAGAELVICGRMFRDFRHDRNGLDGVRFTGFTDAIHDWYESADIFVLPSLLEGSAKAVYEAMGHGLPVVVSERAGSIVTDGHDGLVVPAADPAALAQALVRLLADPDLRTRLGTAARSTVSEYTWERYARSVCDVYRSISGQGG